MSTYKMGFEGLLYYGTAGSTAATLLENCRDITIDLSVNRGNTTVRGDSTSPPIHTEDVTEMMSGLEFTMLNDTADTAFQALQDAAGAGTAIALRGLDHASGKGPDADFTVSISKPLTLEGEQVVTVTAVPTRGSGRAPQRWV